MDSYGRDAWETGPDDTTSPDYCNGVSGSDIQIDEEATLYCCPVCGQETIWFECVSWDRGDGVYAESGYGPAFHQACGCTVTQQQINSFPVMDMCFPVDDDW